MTDTRRRRFFDRFTSNPTFIGKGAVFTGDLIAEGDVTLAGRIVGDGVARGTVTIAIDGHWQGSIDAGHAVISGKVDGSVFAEGKVEIRKTAHILGAVRARNVAIAEGGKVEGAVTVTGDAAVVEFQEKRSS
ncbi:MAG TPA: polymer-forming cytoskeletal protein [Steroidobacteraceae bacterium]|nr:polymer-forming cytoskeletal protein [Steroidobacteraceae bacterium]